MKIFKNFQVSKLLTPDQQDLKDLYNIQFCEDETGVDWYECQKYFSPDTLKFTYNNDGIITSITQDVSGLWPCGQSVVEVQDTEQNRQADIFGEWIFDGKKITPRIPTYSEIVAQAESKKTQLMQTATDAIAPLQDAVDLDIATESEVILLLEWKKYRVLLDRIKTEDAPDIIWPEQPE